MGVLFRNKGRMEEDLDILLKKIDLTLKKKPRQRGATQDNT
jgi:hypothetical protein